jgi:hypothetical protein
MSPVYFLFPLIWCATPTSSPQNTPAYRDWYAMLCIVQVLMNVNLIARTCKKKGGQKKKRTGFLVMNGSTVLLFNLGTPLFVACSSDQIVEYWVLTTPCPRMPSLRVLKPELQKHGQVSFVPKAFSNLHTQHVPLAYWSQNILLQLDICLCYSQRFKTSNRFLSIRWGRGGGGGLIRLVYTDSNTKTSPSSS